MGLTISVEVNLPRSLRAGGLTKNSFDGIICPKSQYFLHIWVKNKQNGKYLLIFLGNIAVLLDINTILPFIWYGNRKIPANFILKN